MAASSDVIRAFGNVVRGVELSSTEKDAALEKNLACIAQYGQVL